MALSIIPYTAEFEAAVERFNRRMSEGGAAADFGIPAHAPISGSAELVQAVPHLAVDEEQEVRGGVIMLEHPGWVNGKTETVLNLQSPLSEGIIDPKYAMTAVQLIRFAVKRTPFVYVVGMGGDQNPLPRLLKASSWTVRPIPFFFRMLNVGRCLRELRPLQSSPFRSAVATLGAATGAGWVAGRILQRSSVSLADYTQQETGQAGSDEDALWNQFRERCSFAIVRTSATLDLYCPKQAGRYRVVRSGQTQAWFSLLISAMRDHKYFGNLKVATLMDVVASTPVDTAAAIALAARHAASAGCELVVTNQIHKELQSAARAAGFLSYASNFLLATSKALTEATNDETVFVTRQDGDGLVNLSDG